ncbi:hypothetical protein AUJ14_00220 [Candidatus Micrarchaeota archaeon CG1_02_55_22]|nr:MAG: hypothetical protein AUJ14_00220 [Candidatus Micrarchaeota archaeon CG1_02_55_22]
MAIAVLDLHGRVVRVESHREWPVEGVVGAIASYSPVVIACDTNPSHSLARSLGSVFGARLFFPRRSLSRHAKMLATRNSACRNPHERDALAAALKAFGHYQNKVRQTEKKARKAGVDAEGIVRRVLFGEKMAHALRR